MMLSAKNIDYKCLSIRAKQYEEESSYEYQTLRPKIPWKGISLAIFLSTTGLGMLTMGILSAFGFLNEEFDDRTSAFFMLGMLMFIPGAYHVWIAYLAYMGSNGYSYEDIPDFD